MQEEIERRSGVNRDTVSWACSKQAYIPSPIVQRKILKALREADPTLKASEFWGI